MLKTKQCKSCEEIKLLSEFGKYALKKDGLDYYCKECRKKRFIAYNRTKKGLVGKIYGNQRSKSRLRGHPLPTYSKQELKEWLYSKPLFHLLYNNWKRLDYQKDYVPSVDRKDDYLSYSIANIQILTWKENNSKGYLDKKEGRNNKNSKAVIQYTKDGEFVAEYWSAMEAGRQTGINRGNISACCRGDKKSAGGFKWDFS